jgi:hypothetical protein
MYRLDFGQAATLLSLAILLQPCQLLLLLLPSLPTAAAAVFVGLVVLHDMLLVKALQLSTVRRTALLLLQTGTCTICE